MMKRQSPGMRKDDELFVIMDEVNLGYEEEEEDLEPELDQLKAGQDELKADLEIKVITLMQAGN